MDSSWEAYQIARTANNGMEKTKKDAQPLSERLPEHIFSRIYQDIGQASMCWDFPEKAGVFHSDVASTIAFNLCQFIADELENVLKNAG